MHSRNTSDQDNSQTTPIRRRTIVKGAAWSIPVIAATAATPLAAASLTPACPTVSQSDFGGWIHQGAPLIGGAENQNPGWFRTFKGLTGFLSMTDSGDWCGACNAPLAYVITDVVIPVTAGTTYTFMIQGVGGYGNSNDNANTRWQGVDININGVTMWTGTTRDALAPGLGIQNIVFSYVAPPGQTSITLTYKFRIPPRPRQDALGANDDILLTTPAITCAA